MITLFIQSFDLIDLIRIARCEKHNLLDIFLLAICAVISGTEGGKILKITDT